MSEFHRMITYLYLYEQGVKSRNIGFAKVEKRDQRCALEVHMKNTGCSLSPVQVYFYIQKKQQLGGIFLGNFVLNRGSGEFKAVLDAENVKDSGYHLDDIKGIYIPLTERTMLVSQWDDDEFKRELFVDLADLADDNTVDALSPEAPGIPESLSSSQIPEESGLADSPAEKTPFASILSSDDSSAVQKPETIQEPESFVLSGKDSAEQIPDSPDLPDSSAPAESLPEEKTDDLHAAETEPAKSPPKTLDALKAVEALPITERRAYGFHSVSKSSRTAQTHPDSESSSDSSHGKSDTSEDWQLRWRFILENFPVMTPFSGDDHTLCVRLELKDIRQLPRQYWYFGNNSFLLHGFFNYRYIILGMTEEFGVKKWFIGIPGVFQNPERVMAALFGFPEFRSEKPSPINTGQFGYWYRYLNELSQPPEKTPS